MDCSIFIFHRVSPTFEIENRLSFAIFGTHVYCSLGLFVEETVSNQPPEEKEENYIQSLNEGYIHLERLCNVIDMSLIDLSPVTNVENLFQVFINHSLFHQSKQLSSCFVLKAQTHKDKEKWFNTLSFYQAFHTPSSIFDGQSFRRLEHVDRKHAEQYCQSIVERVSCKLQELKSLKEQSEELEALLTTRLGSLSESQETQNENCNSHNEIERKLNDCKDYLLLTEKGEKECKQEWENSQVIFSSICQSLKDLEAQLLQLQSQKDDIKLKKSQMYNSMQWIGISIIVVVIGFIYLIVPSNS